MQLETTCRKKLCLEERTSHISVILVETHPYNPPVSHHLSHQKYMLALLSEEPDSLTIVFVKKSHFFQIQVNYHVAHFQKYTLNWCI